MTCSRLFSSSGSISSGRLPVGLRSLALRSGSGLDDCSRGRFLSLGALSPGAAMPSEPPERLGLDLGCEVEHALGADAVPARNLMRSNESLATFQRKLVEELSNFVAFDIQERIVGSLSGHDFTHDE